MSNLLEIYNENFGYSVATNGNYVAVGNPNSKPYTCAEGFSRIGEVSVYKKNKFSKNYTLAKKYRSKTSFERHFVDAYFTEQSSSVTLTASFVTELSGGLENNENFQFNTCSFLILEDGNRVVLQNCYGTSLAMSDNFLAIGDPFFAELYKEKYYSGSAVDIFRVSDPNENVNCENQEFTLSDVPFCTITGSYAEQFGKSVSISNNYVVIGRPDANNSEGRVNIYKYNSDICGFELDSVLSSSDSTQRYFGHSISIDKHSENKIVVGTLTISQSKVHVFEKPSDTQSWYLKQILTQNTASNWLFLTNNSSTQFVPVTEQTYTSYGYSVAIHNNILIVGAPKDLVYYEYEGSSKVRQRGAFYFYYYSSSSREYTLGQKVYGDKDIFKDNLLGYSVDVNDNYFSIGSPKPFFPFSSLYLSSSINRYNDTFGINDFGESTYNGQVLLYKWNRNPCSETDLFSLVTSTLISYRKKVGESFTAYGHDVSISDSNLVVGSPSLLNDDWYLSTPYVAEESGSVTGECVTSETDVLFFTLEDQICDCAGDNINNECTDHIVYKLDQKPFDEIFGKAFIYDFQDLQTDSIIGNVFYNNNKIVVYNTGSVLNDFFKNPLNPLDGYVYGSYQSQLTLNEKQYICTVEPGEFNVSTNPTSITSSYFDYGIINKQKFDFENLDIILRYLNCKITNSKKESWWNILVSGDVENSIFGFYSSSLENYTQNKLNTELSCVLSKKDFDINNDGLIDYSDAFMIWRYYIQTLKIENYKQYLSPVSKRTNYDDIVRFLDLKTGKNVKSFVKTDFLNYKFSSSLDPTGSYLAPYITSVGLYSGTDLVAVAKLASPIKNNLQIPINIVAKWDI